MTFLLVFPYVVPILLCMHAPEIALGNEKFSVRWQAKVEKLDEASAVKKKKRFICLIISTSHQRGMALTKVQKGKRASSSFQGHNADFGLSLLPQHRWKVNRVYYCFEMG